jgi:hypothetical protein
LSTIARPSVVVLASIDTEEDNWVPTRSNIALTNVAELPRLHLFLERLGLRPTYFVSYQVASNPRAVAILRDIAASDRAEIGAHLHPWNTPPTDELLVPRNTMLKNLPRVLQLAKLRHLTEAVSAIAKRAPIAFRAGRWALGPDTVSALIESGYQIDSSVMPFVDWRDTDDGPNFVGAPLAPYRLGPGQDVRIPERHGALRELPVSAGYLRRPFRWWGRVHRLLRARSVRWLGLVGVAARLGVIRQVVLSPEQESVGDMLLLSRRLIEEGVPYLHLFWHSPSLRPGLTPFVLTGADVARLYTTLEAYLEGLEKMTAFTCATLGQWAATALSTP